MNVVTELMPMTLQDFLDRVSELTADFVASVDHTDEWCDGKPSWQWKGKGPTECEWLEDFGSFIEYRSDG